VLFYRNPTNLGRFIQHENITERVLSAPNKALWDQIAIPYACWREKVDLVFHPKFTAPLLAPCKVVDMFIPSIEIVNQPLSGFEWLNSKFEEPI
jgi:hypothetical protein